MKILIGVDDSAHARAALEYVKGFPWPKDTRVILLSVAPTPALVYSEGYMSGVAYDERLVQEQIRAHEDIVRRAGDKLAPAGLNTEMRVVSGDPRLEIEELARSEKVDLVIVGSHGRTGLARLLLGSVATHVVTHAPCSVLVVKEPGRLA